MKDLDGYRLMFKKGTKKIVVCQRIGSHILDQDNYIGGHKPLFDALKKSGIIVDDRAEWCEMAFLPQEKCKRGQDRTVITIEEA